MLAAVNDYVSDEDKRPLTDHVVVQSAAIVNYQVSAKIYVFAGPSASITAELYTANLQDYLEKQHNIGSMVSLSGIYDALHTEGVQKVQLLAPTADIAANKTQAPHCTGINLEVIIVNDSV